MWLNYVCFTLGIAFLIGFGLWIGRQPEERKVMTKQNVTRDPDLLDTIRELTEFGVERGKITPADAEKIYAVCGRPSSKVQPNETASPSHGEASAQTLVSRIS